MPTLDFKGKQFVYSHHLSVPFRELKVVPDKSLPTNGQKPSLDDNLIIHGDNLEALKALLPTHAGKIDCIFIDPPYNTGNEGWCYNDNVRSPLMKEWLKKSANPVDKEDLERHDKWLCMMWPRLNLLSELLSETGTIWITLNDIEIHRARMIFDEIYGEENLVTQIVWQKRTSRENRAVFSNSHDHILVYSKCSPDVWKTYRNLLDPSALGYSNPDNDPKGEWTSVPFSAQGFRTNQVYKIKTPTGKLLEPPKGRCWGATEPVFEQLKGEGRIYFPKEGEGRPRVKQYSGESKGLVPFTIWPPSEVGDNEDAKKEILEIFKDEPPFDTPKPVRLIERIIEIAGKGDSTFLDSFAGSGTTAHAVLEANKKDGGNRRFILIECEDYADKLTAERVRRVIKGYDFTGTQREELYKAKITWSNFSKSAQKILLEVEHVEKTARAAFDKVKKEIKDGVLTVIGERDVQEQAPGLAGSFTFCTLGEPIQIENLLNGKGLPAFDALARYVFYTATGQSLESVAPPSIEGFVGETDLFRVHLFYQPDLRWLRSNEAALNADRVAAIATRNPAGKRTIVFAVAKFMSQKELTKQRIEFCQLPYAVHRILGD